MIARVNILRISACFLVLGVRCAGAGGVDAARALVERILPGRSPEFTIEIIPPADGGRDVYEIDARDGRAVLRGNSPVSIASALNRYLGDGKWGHVSRCGSRLALPRPLPAPAWTGRVESPFLIRFAYNYCTLSYTFAWADEKTWERELDQLALHGYNAALVIAGAEQSGLDTLTAFGYTPEEARAWLVWPSHQAWQQMSNMERFGGAVPASVIDRRRQLGAFIVRRMRELGMEPVLPGFYGIVPTDFGGRHPEARVLPQGSWAGGFKRPALLHPEDPLFPRMADAFHAAQQKYFGPVKYWSADPFHEGGNAQGVDLAAAGKAIQAAQLRSNPDSVWVLQAWGENPKFPMLDAIDKNRALVIDLGCEMKESWRKSQAFHHTPWLWSIIMNFGGNQGMDCRFEAVPGLLPRALADPARGRMCGVAITPEGIDTLPFIWDLAGEQNWKSGASDFHEWGERYFYKRYGVCTPEMLGGLAHIAEAVGFCPVGQMPHNTVLCARPSLNSKLRARAWGTTEIPYSPASMLEGWKSLLWAPEATARSDAYRYDIVDIGRQVLGDYAKILHRRLIAADRKGDLDALRKVRVEMLGLCDDLDTLLSTRREFLLGAWLSAARSWGATETERAGAEWNARMLVTTWGDQTSNLNDYSAREWAGLMKRFYRPRWERFLDALIRAREAGHALDEEAIRRDIAAAELSWTRETDAFPSEPSGNALEIARKMFEKYGPPIRRAVHEPDSSFLPARAEDFTGAWSYPVRGRTYMRIFHPNGTADLLISGKDTPFFKDFRWTVEKNMLVLRKPNGDLRERHALTDADTMVFTVEKWGPAKRQR